MRKGNDVSAIAVPHVGCVGAPDGGEMGRHGLRPGGFAETSGEALLCRGATGERWCVGNVAAEVWVVALRPSALRTMACSYASLGHTLAEVASAGRSESLTRLRFHKTLERVLGGGATDARYLGRTCAAR